MKIKLQAKSKVKFRREEPCVEEPGVIEAQVIPAPTVFWHPSVSLEKLISDFIEHQDSIIVS